MSYSKVVLYFVKVVLLRATAPLQPFYNFSTIHSCTWELRQPRGFSSLIFRDSSLTKCSSLHPKYFHSLPITKTHRIDLLLCLQIFHLIPSGIIMFFPACPSMLLTRGKSASKLLAVKSLLTKELRRRWSKSLSMRPP